MEPIKIDTAFGVYNDQCPTRQALDRIADKWSVLIIGMLEEKPKRFSDLQRAIGGISQKMLTQTLRTLERDGLISRKVYAQVPPRVDYELTPLGRTLIEPIKAIRVWAESNIKHVIAAQEIYDQRTLDQASTN
jgi:DNA-binding HxlR family transcriptional regulator